MWTVVVVAIPPVFGHSAKAVEGFEDIAVEGFGPKGPIEALDVGILGWFAWLDAKFPRVE